MQSIMSNKLNTSDILEVYYYLSKYGTLSLTRCVGAEYFYKLIMLFL